MILLLEEIAFQDRERLKELAMVIALGSGASYSKEGYRALKGFLRSKAVTGKEEIELDADQLNKLM